MDINSLPILLDFLDLKFGDKVFSRRFGLGEFIRLYNDEAVIQFSGRRERIMSEDCDISLVSKCVQKRGRNEMSGEVNGKKVSFKEMKRVMRQDTAENFVSTKVAADILDKNQKQFNLLCDQNNIEITKFGIKKEDLLKLNKIVF